jgi:hypothetical protein
MAQPVVRHDFGKARKLRKALSLPEGLLWRELRRKAGGVKFRNQHPVGPYVIDFYCAAAKLGFEIDGIAHDMAIGRRLMPSAMPGCWSAGSRSYASRQRRSSPILRKLQLGSSRCVRGCSCPLHHQPGAGGPPPHSASQNREEL